MLSLVVLLAAGGVAAALFNLHSPSHSRRTAAGAHKASQRSTSQSSPAAGTTITAPISPSSPQQAAGSLASLLAQSITDRGSVVKAVSDVSQCGPRLSHDPQTFGGAAASRQGLLSRLADLPGRYALPAPMLQALTSAWQASVAADQDFARWAQDEISQGCTQNDQADPNYQAAAGPDGRATTDKRAFINFWNPIAAKYGLKTYQWHQL